MKRKEIQKAFKKICPPRYGEKQVFWFSRLARQLGWPAERVQSLWKDDRCKISFDEGDAINKMLRSSSRAPGPDELEDLNKRFLEQQDRLKILQRELRHEREIRKRLGAFLMGEGVPG